jgi:diaminopimelate decarboxylase
MSSTYNGRPLVPEVLVNGDRYAVVRRRQSLDEMLDAEDVPDWLPAAG